MRSCIITLILASLLSNSCNKDTQPLSEAPPEYLKFMISGKWALEKQRHGFTGEIIQYPPNHRLEFKFSGDDSLIYSINDTVVERSNIVWSKLNEEIDPHGKPTLLSSSIISLVYVAEFGNDRLTLAQPMTDGSAFFLRRIK